MASDEAGLLILESVRLRFVLECPQYSVDEVASTQHIIFDPNIFAVATGIDEHNNYAVRFH
ncbi:hypothetical protein O9992_10910 [Vibrio lentus]|nr:hypothetical protein [Vibrio lentus]